MKILKMIIINNRRYSNYITDISWDSFQATSNGIKREGIAPFITFNIEDKYYIGLELTFSTDMFKNTPVNKEINISKYLSDITYEDEKGWLSISTGKYDCTLTKKSDTNFQLDFYVSTGEDESDINITINTFLEIVL